MSDRPQISRLVEVLRERTRPVGTPVDVMRKDMETAVARVPLAEGVQVTAETIAGRPAERFTPNPCERSRLVIWFHGGGYVMGSPATVRPMVSIFAAALGGAVLAPDYRLAPEHPFPTAVEDALAVYAELLSTHTPEDLALAGDSAGGGLVLACLLAIRDRGLPMPSAAICVSPWADMTSRGVHANDPQVTPEGLAEMADWYMNGADPKDPLASPLYADLSGFPPLLVHVGAAERLAADGEQLAENARRDGVDVTFESWPDMIHVWHAFAPKLEEGTAGIRRLAAWLTEQWSDEAVADHG